LIETHGTSTQLGDSNEVSILNEFWKDHLKDNVKIPIGSVKSNIGHLKTSSGIASIIKTSLALANKLIPPSINFVIPNSKIDFDSSCVYVNTKCRPFYKKGYPRRAAINGFGFGGINTHILLEEYSYCSINADSYLQHKKNYNQFENYKVLLIGEDNITNLINRIESIKHVIPFISYEEYGEFLYNCNIYSSNKKYIVAIVVSDVADIIKNCSDIINKFKSDRNLEKIENEVTGVYFYRDVKLANDQIGFIFPGQGSHYVNMGRDLINAYPEAENTLLRAEKIFKNEQEESL